MANDIDGVLIRAADHVKLVELTEEFGQEILTNFTGGEVRAGSEGIVLAILDDTHIRVQFINKWPLDVPSAQVRFVA